MEYRVWSSTAEETRRWGKKLAGRLQGGDAVALLGDLGAGKTAFSQGVGEGLKVTGPMTSPTFTLMHEYIGQLQDGQGIRLIHMDLYRLQHPEEAEVIGVEEAFREDTVCLIEWPEIAEALLPEDQLEIEIKGSGELPREIVFRAKASEWEPRLEGIFNDEILNH